MRSRARVWWVAGVSVAVTAAIVGVSVGLAAPTVSGQQPARRVFAHKAAHKASDGSALAVLHRWDRRRARSWASGDPASLARLYVAGSRTGRRDVRDLTLWTARGLRVDGLHQQVATFRLVDRCPGRIVVVVTDRTIDGIAVGGAWRTAVPTSAWATHRISFRRSADRWQVSEVTRPAAG